MVVQARPHGLYERVCRRVLGHLDDAVAQEDRHEGVRDGGREVLHRAQREDVAARRELVPDHVGVDAGVVWVRRYTRLSLGDFQLGQVGSGRTVEHGVKHVADLGPQLDRQAQIELLGPSLPIIFQDGIPRGPCGINSRI